MSWSVMSTGEVGHVKFDLKAKFAQIKSMPFGLPDEFDQVMQAEALVMGELGRFASDTTGVHVEASGTAYNRDSGVWRSVNVVLRPIELAKAAA